MENQTLALLARARARGGSAVVALLEGSAPDGVETLRVRAPRRRPARDRAFALRGVEALRGARCDAVLAIRHALSCDVYLPRGGLVADARAAQDRSRGGPRPGARLLRRVLGKERFFLEAEAALLADPKGPRVVALSRALEARMRALYPATRGRIVVIPNGVDVERFRAEPFAGERARLRADLGGEAYVGLHLAHDPRLKGLDTVLRAMARPEVTALSPPFRLLVAGRRPKASLVRLARRLGVASAVRWQGPQKDPRPLYAAADVFVHPTWYDPCSTACLEALAMGLPVVTTPVNGAAELMGMRGGIVVEAPGLPDAVAVALRTLADPALRAITADDARYLAETNRQERRLDRILDLCEEAAR
jgi:UDP-glucose:(heptosyl)LPS alpha-1,3-glucosyltransferase